MCAAMLAGMGAEHIYQKSRGLDTKVQQMNMRKPREPCETSMYASEPVKESPHLPGVPEKIVYCGLAMLVVAFVANEMRKKRDEQLEELTKKKWHPENFFGTKDDFYS